MNRSAPSSVYYFNPEDNLAAFRFSETLSSLLHEYCKPYRPIVFLCIGSDRVTGDSLGPLIGYKLSDRPLQNFYVYGTLKNPVHALNMNETLENIYIKHPNAFIVAIDASLGSRKHLGLITLGVGPLLPGAGVKKELSAVGDLFITGIVNISGALEHLLLQTTRLSTVMSMVDCITLGIRLTSRKSHFSWVLAEEKPAIAGMSLPE